MTEHRFRAQLIHNGALCAIPIEFDPKPLFGKIRAPVIVSLNGYSYRSTIAAMHGELFIPLRRSHREAAGLRGDECLDVVLALDSVKREVVLPADVAALLSGDGLPERWQSLSYSHQREHIEAIEQARKPETRQRRIDKLLTALRSKT